MTDIDEEPSGKLGVIKTAQDNSTKSLGWTLTLRNPGCPPHLPDSCGSAQFGARVVIECDALNRNQSTQRGHLILYSVDGSTQRKLADTQVSDSLRLVHKYSAPPAPTESDTRRLTHAKDDFLCELREDRNLISSRRLIVRYGCTSTYYHIRVDCIIIIF